MTTECAHNWKLGPDVEGVCHGRCLKCGEEQDFPQRGNPVELVTKHTPQITPQAPTRNRSRILERHRFYEEHREEILADLSKLGRPTTLKKWKLPAGTMVGLLRRWGPGVVPRKAAASPRPPTDQDALAHLDKAMAAVKGVIRSFEEKRRQLMRGAGAINRDIYREQRRLKDLQHARALLMELMGQGGTGEPDQNVRG